MVDAVTPEERNAVSWQRVEAALDLLLALPAGEREAATLRIADGGMAPGTRLGAWAVVEPIGRGGMGQVYRGRRADGQFEQDVAIKVARADAARAWQRFP